MHGHRPFVQVDVPLVTRQRWESILDGDKLEACWVLYICEKKAQLVYVAITVNVVNNAVYVKHIATNMTCSQRQ